LERLIERCGRRLNEVVDGNLRTLLHMAVENKHSVALGRLLECADLDVNAQDAVLRTPLHYVADSKEGDSKLLSIGSQLLS
uniref:Uncharacterized protein n=1 Tax=Plectus sambesii TaxID=2011161 RepID=A0A914VME5_9BILA